MSKDGPVKKVNTTKTPTRITRSNTVKPVKPTAAPIMKKSISKRKQKILDDNEDSDSEVIQDRSWDAFPSCDVDTNILLAQSNEKLQTIVQNLVSKVNGKINL